MFIYINIIYFFHRLFPLALKCASLVVWSVEIQRLDLNVEQLTTNQRHTRLFPLEDKPKEHSNVSEPLRFMNTWVCSILSQHFLQMNLILVKIGSTSKSIASSRKASRFKKKYVCFKTRVLMGANQAIEPSSNLLTELLEPDLTFTYFNYCHFPKAQNSNSIFA